MFYYIYSIAEGEQMVSCLSEEPEKKQKHPRLGLELCITHSTQHNDKHYTKRASNQSK